MRVDNPYSNLPPEAFWRSGVAERDTLDPGRLYVPKFPIDKTMRIMTAGSCFAQHVGRHLKNAGFRVMDAEPLPVEDFPGVTDATANRFGYRMYSARYGNIYTVRQLRQLKAEAHGEVSPAEPVWERDCRYFDSQRPNVEPEGLASPEDVLAHRARHLQAVKGLFRRADLIVFTFGLTEAWLHKETGTVYPTAPGTIAGRFDPDVFEFRNFGFNETLDDFLAIRDLVMRNKPDVKFLVTVSPVPLVATMSGQHVEVATAYSKSVLRAVCGELSATCENVDYFPSYEIITSQNARGAYFRKNMRSISDQGVATAMQAFFAAHGYGESAPRATRTAAKKGGQRQQANVGEDAVDDVVCEEALLEAFSP